MGRSGRMQPVPENMTFAAGQADAGCGDVHEPEGSRVDPGPLGQGRDIKPIESYGRHHLQVAENGLQTFV